MARKTTVTVRELQIALETARDIVDAVRRILDQLDPDLAIEFPGTWGPFACAPTLRAGCGRPTATSRRTTTPR